MGRLIKEPVVGGTRVNTRLSPFVMPVERYAPAGSTIRQIVEMHKDAGRNAIVFINGERVPKCMWDRIKPKPNAIVTVSLVSGGGGGGGGKNPLRVVLTIAVIVLAAYAGPALAAYMGFTGAATATAAAGATIGGLSAATSAAIVGGVISGVITMAGGMLVNALAPASAQAQSGYSSYGGTTTATTYTITGAQNKANQFGPLPRVFGRRKVFPVYAAVPYDETVGNDQYMRMLFSFGAGPLELSDFRIGETPLSLYEGVEIEVRNGYSTDTPITLYSHTVREDSLSTRLYANIPRTFESRAEADELSFDIGFTGLVTYNSSANRGNRTVNFKVEYRKVDAEDWVVEHESLAITAATDQTYKYNLRIVTNDRAKYQVRITRLTADNTSTSVRDEAYFSVLRTITYTPPTGSGIDECLVALRIKASGQLNGTISNFSAIAEALLPGLDDDLNWTAPRKTRNPADAALEVMRGSLNMRPVVDSKIVLSAFKDWADYCDELDQNGEPRFQYDAVIDGVTTVDQLVRAIMGSARSMMTRPGGKIGVAIDRKQTVAAQLFTPREIQSFKLKRTFYDMPHAVRVRFVNPDKDWSQDEVIAYADGYDESNATLFEVLELPGVVRASQAWRDGRYHLSAAIARPNEYELVCDINHLMCDRGRMVKVQHDVTRWGLGSGRVIERTLDGDGNIVSLTFDETFTLEVSKSYSIRCRLETGELILLSLTTPGGGYQGSTLLLAGVLADTDGPQIGDLCAFGETGKETVNLIVKYIQRQGDLSATVVCVDEAPGIHTSDTGTLPSFDPQTNWPGQGATQQSPSAPIIESVVSDETVMILTGAGYIPAVRFSFVRASGASVTRNYLETRWRRSGSGDSWNHELYPNAPDVISITGVDDHGVYDFEFRYVAGVSYASNWTSYGPYQVIGRSTPPPDVFGLTLVQNQLRWSYPSRPVDFAGFRVLYNFGNNTTRTVAIEAHPGTLLDVASFPITAIPVTEVTFIVVAVDTMGNESVIPATLNRDLRVYLPGRFGDIVVANVVETAELLDAPVLADDSIAFWGVNSDPFWGANSDPFWLDTVYAPLTVTRTVTPSDLWTPVQMTLAWNASAGATIEYQHFGDAAFWGDDADPFWGDDADPFWVSDGPFAPWAGSLYMMTGDWVTVRGSAPGGMIQGQFTSITASFDVPDVSEDLVEVAIDSAGTRLPITKTYRAIKAVGNVTLVQDGGDAVSVRRVDLNASLGPLMQCIDASGNPTDGTIDCTVKGY